MNAARISAGAVPRAPITLINREMDRQGAKNAKIFISSWRSWRLGGSKSGDFQTVSTCLSF
jgi:hypothetical protein